MSHFNSEIWAIIRIEGRDQTIFEGVVKTNGHDVTASTGGTHPADGTNNNEHPYAVPTCTSALADIAKVQHFTWDGKFYESFEDFFITRIKNDTAGSGEYWQLALNFRRANLGGGQLEIKAGDNVLWALIKPEPSYNSLAPLKLNGPRSAKVNVEFIVTVLDGETRKPVAGAIITPGEQKTDSQGQAKVKYNAAQIYTLKANYDGHYVRSDALNVTVTQ
ncbi:hypothetical protein L208DRAFT_1329097 [Tricholoma matsutake]|nr:hypothetical protein L208DRAFT_1329097 [Tricholoma matsutake 945]